MDSAEAFLKHDRLQLVPMLRECLLSVLVKEELRVSQSRAEHPLIAVLHDVKMLPAAIPHGDEKREQFSSCVLHREVPLMVAHRGNHSLGWQLQIFILEMTAQSSRILDEIRYLLQQLVIDLGLAAIFLCDRLNLLANHFAATLLIHYDELALARGLIACRVLYVKRLVSQKSVTARRPARCHRRDLKRHYFLAV